MDCGLVEAEDRDYEGEEDRGYYHKCLAFILKPSKKTPCIQEGTEEEERMTFLVTRSFKVRLVVRGHRIEPLF